MKIKVKYHSDINKIQFIDKGEWIDLRCVEDVPLKAPFANTLNGNRTSRDVEFDSYYLNLGIAMKLPKYFEAWIVPRSSSFKHWGIIQSNHMGIIDSSYSGTYDVWKMPVIAFKDSCINKGDRVCQFRIMPSQKAPIWTKIKWLFTNKIKFIEVDKLQDDNRGGFGSTGIK